ncbi:sialic acid-binding Ig-like lectin 14 [Garra rufa]|uniref:sialic acid-binding Ig-like lectin 14 n=1 Tax=Garra rufa TaxID=137080 RepID=UPI003CCEE845
MDTAEKIIIFCFLLKGVCCRDFNISLPEKIEALSGSCVIINCRFEIRKEHDRDFTEVTGVWFKDGTDVNKHLVFNSSTSSQNSFIKANITGKLKDKNCTTVFYDLRSTHSGKYYFRIEGEGELKWTFRESNVSIHVFDSPRKPTVQLYVDQKEVQDQEEVLEGSSVSLRCSAETLCSSPPPTLTWSSTPRIPFSESSRLQELILISDLNFTATHHQPRVTFTCTITYQLQDKNKTAQNNITLHVQYVPKISNSSSCTISDVTVCFCEVDGNPSPELEWHLSGRPVSNSSNTFISEERLSSTGLRSSITLHQSLTHTSTLRCVSNNTHGTASQLLQLPSFSSSLGLNIFSVLIGVAVVALVVMLLSTIAYMCLRKENGKLSQTIQEHTKRSGQNTNEVFPQENQEDSVSVMMSSAGAVTANEESIYSSIDFTNSKRREVWSVSSLYTDYAVVQYCSGGLANTERSMGESSRSTGDCECRCDY